MASRRPNSRMERNSEAKVRGHAASRHWAEKRSVTSRKTTVNGAAERWEHLYPFLWSQRAKTLLYPLDKPRRARRTHRTSIESSQRMCGASRILPTNPELSLDHKMDLRCPCMSPISTWSRSPQHPPNDSQNVHTNQKLPEVSAPDSHQWTISPMESHNCSHRAELSPIRFVEFVKFSFFIIWTPRYKNKSKIW